VALAFLYTARGIPCLYYGTEQAFNGGTDPDDREDMFAGRFKDAGRAGEDSFNMTHPLFRLIAKLNNFRRLYPALTLGAQVNQEADANGPGLLAYSRRLGGQEMLVVLNTANDVRTMGACRTIYRAGTRMVNLLDPNEIIAVTDGSNTPLLSVPPGTAKIFIAQSQWRPLDPVVSTNYPPHGAQNIPAGSPVIVHFSQPMDTNRVQRALSIVPAVQGGFQWNMRHDTLTFTPGGTGWPAPTNVVVRIARSASAAASGASLFATYELKFQTAAHEVR
jgi:hypothetical protein